MDFELFPDFISCERIDRVVESLEEERARRHLPAAERVYISMCCLSLDILSNMLFQYGAERVTEALEEVMEARRVSLKAAGAEVSRSFVPNVLTSSNTPRIVMATRKLLEKRRKVVPEPLPEPETPPRDRTPPLRDHLLSRSSRWAVVSPGTEDPTHELALALGSPLDPHRRTRHTAHSPSSNPGSVGREEWEEARRSEQWDAAGGLRLLQAEKERVKRKERDQGR